MSEANFERQVTEAKRRRRDEIQDVILEIDQLQQVIFPTPKDGVVKTILYHEQQALVHLEQAKDELFQAWVQYERIIQQREA